MRKLPREVSESFEKLKSLMTRGDMSRIAERLHKKLPNISTQFKNPRNGRAIREIIKTGFEVVYERIEKDKKELCSQ